MNIDLPRILTAIAENDLQHGDSLACGSHKGYVRRFDILDSDDMYIGHAETSAKKDQEVSYFYFPIVKQISYSKDGATMTQNKPETNPIPHSSQPKRCQVMQGMSLS